MSGYRIRPGPLTNPTDFIRGPDRHKATLARSGRIADVERFLEREGAVVRYHHLIRPRKDGSHIDFGYKFWSHGSREAVELRPTII